MVAASKILLKSNDDELVEVDRSIIRLSKVLNTIFQDVGMDEQDGNDGVLTEAIPLADVNGVILRKVIEWCQHHKNDPPNKNYDVFSNWDMEFLKVDQETLFELILAANYLDIEGLTKAACNKVGELLRGKSVEQIKEMFNMNV
ncbi:hypothetical protein ACQ4LE_009963 [Meloidogyne hapla]